MLSEQRRWTDCRPRSFRRRGPGSKIGANAAVSCGGTRKGLGQGKGRVAHLYPDGTIEQAIEIAQLRRQNLDLDEIGWRLWLAGYPVERGLVRYLQIYGQTLRRLRRGVSQAPQKFDELVDGHISK